MYAAHKDHLEALHYLVEQGLVKDKVDSGGHTALMLAAAEGHLEALRCLVEQGVDKDKSE